MDKLPPEPPSAEVTPEQTYLRRRELVKKAALFTITGGAWGAGLVALSSRGTADPPPAPPAIPDTPGSDNPWRSVLQPSRFDTKEATTEFGDITTYNNYYELGLSKSAPAQHAGSLKTRPWHVRIEGEIEHPQTVDIDRLLRWFPPRAAHLPHALRGGMVDGHPLDRLSPRRSLIKRLEPHLASQVRRLQDPARSGATARARKPTFCPGRTWRACASTRRPIRSRCMAVGLYGAPLLGQNGAPLRLVVPWKYGFKGIKSIVRHRAHRAAAGHHLERWPSPRVRLLRQRESRGRSPALEPGERAAHRRDRAHPHADVQRLRRARGAAVRAAWIWSRSF